MNIEILKCDKAENITERIPAMIVMDEDGNPNGIQSLGGLFCGIPRELIRGYIGNQELGDGRYYIPDAGYLGGYLRDETLVADLFIKVGCDRADLEAVKAALPECSAQDYEHVLIRGEDY
jgi:hypothetical protein